MSTSLQPCHQFLAQYVDLSSPMSQQVHHQDLPMHHLSPMSQQVYHQDLPMHHPSPMSQQVYHQDLPMHHPSPMSQQVHHQDLLMHHPSPMSQQVYHQDLPMHHPSPMSQQVHHPSQMYLATPRDASLGSFGYDARFIPHSPSYTYRSSNPEYPALAQPASQSPALASDNSDPWSFLDDLPGFMDTPTQHQPLKTVDERSEDESDASWSADQGKSVKRKALSQPVRTSLKRQCKKVGGESLDPSALNQQIQGGVKANRGNGKAINGKVLGQAVFNRAAETIFLSRIRSGKASDACVQVRIAAEKANGNESFIREIYDQLQRTPLNTPAATEAHEKNKAINGAAVRMTRLWQKILTQIKKGTTLEGNVDDFKAGRGTLKISLERFRHADDFEMKPEELGFLTKETWKGRLQKLDDAIKAGREAMQDHLKVS